MKKNNQVDNSKGEIVMRYYVLSDGSVEIDVESAQDFEREYDNKNEAD